MVTCFDLNAIVAVREINAAVINISGRQRMLSQRAALLGLRLVCTGDGAEQEKLRQDMLATVELMEKSHYGLINGDPEMKLLGQPSEAVWKIYFEAPYYLDRQIRTYIERARALARSSSSQLTQENPDLQFAIEASETDLMEALEALVAGYQKESDRAQLTIEIQKAEL